MQISNGGTRRTVTGAPLNAHQGSMIWARRGVATSSTATSTVCALLRLAANALAMEQVGQ